MKATSTWTSWRDPDVRYYADCPKLLISPNMIEVFKFGHVLCGIEDPTGYIVAESFEDAWEELCEYAYSIDGPCDHGATDELAAKIAEAEARPDDDPDRWSDLDEWIAVNCDCEHSESGYVWMVDNYWMRPMQLPVEKLFQAFQYREGMEVW